MPTLNLVHRVQTPSGSAGQRFPAIVMVHGWLGNENVMSIFERVLPRGVVVISPRAPVAAEAGSYGWFVHLDDPDELASGLAALSQFVADLPAVYPVDPGQVILVGFSQGAAISYALALAEPPRVAAVAGLAGFLPEPAHSWAQPGRLAGKPVFSAHGTKDETVPVEKAREAASLLRQAGAEVSLHEYDIGHKLNAQGMQDLKLWLAAQVPTA